MSNKSIYSNPGNEHIVDLLIRNGANIRLMDKNGKTPLPLD